MPIDLSHLQALAQASESDNDPALQAEIEKLLGKVLSQAVVLNRYDFYPTQPAVITTGLDALAPCTPRLILEPSAGTGAWLPELRRRWPDATIHVVEKNPVNRLALKEVPGIVLVSDDFLLYYPEERYDLIVGNPPFGDGSDKLAWTKHLSHAIELLAPDGQMMMVAPMSLTFRYDKAIRPLRDKCVVHELPSDAFKDSGTAIKTVLAWHNPSGTLEPRFQVAQEPVDGSRELEDPLTLLLKIREDMKQADRHISSMIAMIAKRSDYKQEPLI